MEVDQVISSAVAESSSKRKAEDDVQTDAHKKARVGKFNPLLLVFIGRTLTKLRLYRAKSYSSQTVSQSLI